jgi:hypothetical protein
MAGESDDESTGSAGLCHQHSGSLQVIPLCKQFRGGLRSVIHDRMISANKKEGQLADCANWPSKKWGASQ